MRAYCIAVDKEGLYYELQLEDGKTITITEYGLIENIRLGILNVVNIKEDCGSLVVDAEVKNPLGIYLRGKELVIGDNVLDIVLDTRGHHHCHYSDPKFIAFTDTKKYAIELIDGTYVSFEIKQLEVQSIVFGKYLKNINTCVFSNYPSLKKVILPKSVRRISDGAFMGCTALEEVYIPDSVTYIGEAAFAACTSLKNVRLPENKIYTTLEENMFMDCVNLEKLVLPENISKVKSGACAKCSNLSLEVNGRTKLDAGVF